MENHFKRFDPIMYKWMSKYGPISDRTSNVYRITVSTIIGQLISFKAARSIRTRLYDTVGAYDLFSPELVVQLDDETWDYIGISKKKRESIMKLSTAV